MPAWAKEGLGLEAGRGALQGVPAGRVHAFRPLEGTGAKEDGPCVPRGGGAWQGTLAEPKRGYEVQSHPTPHLSPGDESPGRLQVPPPPPPQDSKHSQGLRYFGVASNLGSL